MPCSACGLSKRHLFDDAARRGGYDVVVTGHNLDDEAAVLFGNVLRWDAEYLGRQLPVLPERRRLPPQGEAARPAGRAGDGGVVRAARHRLPVVEECPMAAGNKHLGYKAALNAIEVASPGHASTPSTSGSSTEAPARFAPAPRQDGRRPRACERCGAPTTGEVCAFCRLVERTAGAEPVAFTGATRRRQLR